MTDIDPREPEKHRLSIDDKRMAYVEMGAGQPVLFQHGNPTSSYLWRNIMPYLADRARCLAVDLIGMGDSDKLSPSGPDRYRFEEHRHYLDAAWDALCPDEPVVLVLHDWGSALGFDWARRHPDRVRGICYMEAIVKPLRLADWPEAVRGIFEGFRSSKGEALVLERNMFVERVLPNGVLRGLTEAEMAVYRRPFLEPGESRRPTLTWPREIPFDGQPADVHAIVEAYADWMAETRFPKLFIKADPGVIMTDSALAFCESWHNQCQITVPGAHFIQEDCPDRIGEALRDWYDRL